MARCFDQGYALLIGVGQSVCPEWSLPVTVRDARALKAVLTDPAYCGYRDDPRHVRLLSNEEATQCNIVQALETLAASTAQEPDATVVIYYSGHGWLQRDAGDYFLVPHDTAATNLLSTALPAERFVEALRRIQPHRLLVIVDTCFAEGMATAKSLLPKGFNVHGFPEGLAHELSRGTGRAVFTSCRGKESSWVLPGDELSIFTHHLIEALQGAGSQPGDDLVHVSNLMHYVAQAVPRTARKLGWKQTPFFKLESEDFPVALIRGGKGISAAPPSGDPYDESVASLRAERIAGEARVVGKHLQGAGHEEPSTRRQKNRASAIVGTVEEKAKLTVTGQLTGDPQRRGRKSP